MQDPAQRFGIAEVMRHPWFQTDLPSGWDELNGQCLQQQVHLLSLPYVGDCVTTGGSAAANQQLAQWIDSLTLIQVFTTELTVQPSLYHTRGMLQMSDEESAAPNDWIDAVLAEASELAGDTARQPHES